MNGMPIVQSLDITYTLFQLLLLHLLLLFLLWQHMLLMQMLFISKGCMLLLSWNKWQSHYGHFLYGLCSLRPCMSARSQPPLMCLLWLPLWLQLDGQTSSYAVYIDFHHSETTLAQNDFAAVTSRHDDRGMLIFVMRSSRRRESLELGGHQGGI